MADYSNLVLTGKPIKSSFQHLAQTTGSTLVGADGNKISSLDVTASFVLNSSGGGTTLVTGSTVPITSSWALNAVNGGTSIITASTIPITSSWAVNAVNTGTTIITASTVPITASVAIIALTASGYQPSLVTGSTLPITASRAITSSNSISSSYALFAQSSPATTLITASTYQITASFAVSSSAAGLIGQINASVREWSDTAANIISTYPSGSPIGVLAYVTDASSVRIGDGTTIGGAPTGVRYWPDITTVTTADGKAAELAVLRQTDTPPDQVNTSNTGAFSLVFLNTTSSNSYPSWYCIGKVKNGHSQQLINIDYNGLSTINVSDCIFSLDFGEFGISGSIVDFVGMPGISSLTPLIYFKLGSGGDCISGGSGGNGGTLTSPYNLFAGDGGDATGASSTGGDGGVNQAAFNFVGGSGGSGSSGGHGGAGGVISNIFNYVGGRGGDAAGGFTGGTGGAPGSITCVAGNGADGAGINGGFGGRGGSISLSAGHASASANGGDGGNIDTAGQSIYIGGSISSAATADRAGGSITTFLDSYSPALLFSLTSSAGSFNTSSENNLWTGSNIAGFNSPQSNTIGASVIDHPGRTMRVKANGFIISDGTQTFQFRLYFGPTVIWQSPTSSITTSGNQLWDYNGLFTCRTISSLLLHSTGSILGQGMITCFTNPSSSTNLSIVNTTSSVINTTLSNQIRLTAKWTTGSIANNIQCTNAIVEFVN